MSFFQTAVGTTRRRRRLTDGARHVVLICISLVVLLPLAWMVASSLKSNSAIFVYPPQLVPTHPEFGNYRKAFDYIPFRLLLPQQPDRVGGHHMRILFCASWPPTPLPYSRWRGRDLVFYLVLAGIMLPFQVLMVPLYVMYRDLHFLGTLLPRSWPRSSASTFPRLSPPASPSSCYGSSSGPCLAAHRRRSDRRRRGVDNPDPRRPAHRPGGAS